MMLTLSTTFGCRKVWIDSLKRDAANRRGCSADPQLVVEIHPSQGISNHFLCFKWFSVMRALFRGAGGMPQEHGFVVADPQVSRAQFNPRSVKQNIEISKDSKSGSRFPRFCVPRVRCARVHLGASQKMDGIHVRPPDEELTITQYQECSRMRPGRTQRRNIPKLRRNLRKPHFRVGAAEGSGSSIKPTYRSFDVSSSLQL